MRCREAKRRLNHGAAVEGELAEHIRACASCAVYKAAGKRLEVAFDVFRDRQPISPTPFSDIRGIVKSKAVIGRKGISLMSKVKNEIQSNRKVGISLIAAACLFVLLVLVPFSYDQTVGYTVTFEQLDPAYVTLEDRLSLALASLGLDRAVIEFVDNDHTVDCRIGNLPTKQGAREAAAAFRTVYGYDGPAVIASVVRETSASLYAQVKDKLSKIEIDAKGKTDAEIKEEIEDKLRMQGFVNPKVSVETKPDGMRQIAVGLTDSSDAKVSKRQLEIVVPGDDISFEAHQEISIDSEGKTDEQITEEIKKKLAEQGIENPEITVKTDADGKRNIEVEIKKEKED